MALTPAVTARPILPALPGWLSFLLRRTARLVVSLWVLLTASFLMLHLIPGDPVRLALGRTAPAETVALRREQLGLNDGLLAQYLQYLGNVLTGDFGVSMVSGVPVSQTIDERLPPTLQIAVAAFVLTVLITVPLGLLAAVVTRAGRRPRLEMMFVGGGITLASIPSFLTASVLVAVFAVGLGWAPPATRAGLDSYVLPVIALSVGPIAILARILRVEILSVLDHDFVRTARAKRLPPSRVLLRHVLPNACTGTLTLGGLTLSGLVAGTVLVENVFAWPGLGTEIVAAIRQKDYPVVQGIVLVYGLTVLLTNVVVDALLALLDPRSLIKGA